MAIKEIAEMELGEIRGGEAFDLLQLLNTGRNGTISTVHGNSATQGSSRFTTCVLQSGVEMPYLAIKSNIAESLNVIVQIDRRHELQLQFLSASKLREYAQRFPRTVNNVVKDHTPSFWSGRTPLILDLSPASV